MLSPSCRIICDVSRLRVNFFPPQLPNNGGPSPFLFTESREREREILPAVCDHNYNTFTLSDPQNSATQLHINGNVVVFMCQKIYINDIYFSKVVSETGLYLK